MFIFDQDWGKITRKLPSLDLIWCPTNTEAEGWAYSSTVCRAVLGPGSKEVSLGTSAKKHSIWCTEQPQYQHKHRGANNYKKAERPESSTATRKKVCVTITSTSAWLIYKLSWKDQRGEVKASCRGTSSNETSHPSSATSICFKQQLFSIKLTWKLVSSYFWVNLFTSSFYWQKYCYCFSFLPALQSHLSTEEVNRSLFWHKAERTQLDLRSQDEFSVLAVQKVMVLFVN